MTEVDELTTERWAMIADQALCETEAAQGRRLGRHDAQRIIVRELRRHVTEDVAETVVARVVTLLLDERGYVSALSGGRVLPQNDAEDRSSFVRLLVRRRAS